MVRKQLSYQRKIHEQNKIIPLFGEMGHHALAGRKRLSISLSNGAGAMAQWECEWKRGGCGWLEKQRGLKASTGSITIYKRGFL